MTRDDIIRMAREALWPRQQILNDLPEISRFANLVAAHEREECAKLCDWLNGEPRLMPAGCAAAIRARSTK